MSPIAQYHSCLDYLRDVYAMESTANSQVNLASFAKSLGIAPSTLHMILNGKRNLTIKHIQNLSTLMKLNPTERDYLETLFLRNHSEQRGIKSQYDTKLKELANSIRVERRRQTNRFVLSDWRIPMVLIYLWDVIGTSQLNDERRDQFAKKFHVSVKQLNSWIEACSAAGFLKMNQNGSVHLIMDGIARKISQKNYLRAVLKELSDRVNTEYEDPAHVFRSFTFSVSPENLKTLKSEINDLFESYMVQKADSSSIVVTAFAGVMPPTKHESKI